MGAISVFVRRMRAKFCIASFLLLTLAAVKQFSSQENRHKHSIQHGHRTAPYCSGSPSYCGAGQGPAGVDTMADDVMGGIADLNRRGLSTPNACAFMGTAAALLITL